MQDMLDLEIAGVNFTIHCGHARILQEHDPAYALFLKTERDPEALNIDIKLELNGLPDTEGLKEIFDSGQSWSLLSDGDDYFLMLKPQSFSRQALWTARFDRDITRMTIYCGEMFIKKEEGQLSVSNPFRYPLDQLLLMYILAQKEGVILHAAGVEMHDNGYVFLGKSGAGKSTLSRELFKRRHIEVLSDDRIVVRKMRNNFMAFGTPWPGEEGMAVNKSVPLSAMFFLSHGDQNKIEGINPQKAIERLLPVVSIPWYDKEIMTNILLFCDDIIANVPSYELQFKPGEEVVDVFEKFISG